MIWIYVFGGLFAALGIITFVRWIISGWKRFIETMHDLTGTLKDAAEVAKAYREDVQILKQIAQSGANPNFGMEPESIIPQQERTAPVHEMPSPYFARFTTKPIEEDAPLESSNDVDLTPTDDDLLSTERNDSAVNFETQERQKAATREADQARIKELADLGINTNPEEK